MPAAASHRQPAPITSSFPAPPEFTSAAFNAYCKGVTSSGVAGPDADGGFHSNRAIIEAARAEPRQNVITTPWGGVVITHHEHPKVEKFLVVDAGKWLAYEWHAEKLETLKVHEGYGLLLYTPDANVPSKLATLELKPGVEITLQPRCKHCIIAINNLLVFEESTDPRGMDNDLNFDHTPVY